MLPRILRLRTTQNLNSRSLAAAAAGSESLMKTALYDLHKELGGDMVPFAGYELPVLYKGENGGVMKEHLWCRAEGKSALFDVSHMGQVSLLHSHNNLSILCLTVIRDDSQKFICFFFTLVCLLLIVGLWLIMNIIINTKNNPQSTTCHNNETIYQIHKLHR